MERSEPPAAALRCSVVVPVYNEGANIDSLLREARQVWRDDYELLIVYDFPEDNTLPAIEALSVAERVSNLRLVHNTLGRGVRYAIEAGMKQATAPVVVVMMADLSDDFSILHQMVALAEGGAAVVCSSRYMKGGRQIGGPILKGLLSRMAGVSLYWLAGLPTHDPTNSYKAYRKDFLDRTPIESPAGFCLAMELTVKAHFSGQKVCEIPETWRDRCEGESRFNLRKWLPLYLHWYFWAIRRRLGFSGEPPS
jgi:dolichol-phosphate mannosyltransferase